jgi:hypothetical protein
MLSIESRNERTQGQYNLLRRNKSVADSNLYQTKPLTMGDSVTGVFFFLITFLGSSSARTQNLGY